MVRNNKFTHIKYRLPNGTSFILTSRPDAYEESQIDAFIEEFKPTVRFQITDDKMRRETASSVPFHWHSWFPGRRLPVEVAFQCLSLLNYYAHQCEKDTIIRKIWMHCDSSTMRAPTFLGLFLNIHYKDSMEEIIEKSKYNCSYRRKSCPKYYADISMNLDPGIKDLVENWQQGGEEQAHNFIANHRN